MPDGARRSGIARVAASGGEVRPVSRRERGRVETEASAPQFLPDGGHFLYRGVSLGANGEPEAGLFVGSLGRETPTRVPLDPGPGEFDLRYAAPGYLLYTRDGTLMAQRFDVKQLTLSGGPVPIVERVQAFAASDTGVLVYRQPPLARQRSEDDAGPSDDPSASITVIVNWPSAL